MVDPGYYAPDGPEEPTVEELLEKIIERLTAIEITLGEIWRMKQTQAPKVPLPEPDDDVPF